MTNDLLSKYMNENMEEFLVKFKEFIELETPSHENKRESDKCADFLENLFSELGFDIERIPQKTCGDHIYGEFGKGNKTALIVGHYDTVFPIGSIKNMPFKIDGDKVLGPGVLDMKGGILMTYFAIKALISLDLLPDSKIGIFFNSDEESGSHCSSNLIIEKAKQYKCALVVEPGLKELGSVKVARHGRGTYEIRAHGVSAHSGSNPHLAVSPLLELAKQLIRIEEWDKSLDDVTFAPTAIIGGIFDTCVVPEEAKFSMDVRYKTKRAVEEIHKKILDLKPIDSRINLEVCGKIDKPLMEADMTLYEKVKEIGRGYGVEIKGVSIGGGSDGNFTADAGIPTLDGLGTTGEFLHNPAEYANISHIPVRTAILAELIKDL